MKKILLLTTVCSGLLFAGCNTIGGAGEDLQSVGETIEDAAT